MTITDKLKYLNPVYWIKSSYEFGVSEILQKVPQNFRNRGYNERSARKGAMWEGYFTGFFLIPATAATVMGALIITGFMIGLSTPGAAVASACAIALSVFRVVPYIFGSLSAAVDTAVELFATRQQNVTQVCVQKGASLGPKGETSVKFTHEADANESKTSASPKPGAWKNPHVP